MVILIRATTLFNFQQLAAISCSNLLLVLLHLYGISHGPWEKRQESFTLSLFAQSGAEVVVVLAGDTVVGTVLGVVFFLTSSLLSLSSFFLNTALRIVS